MRWNHLFVFLFFIMLQQLIKVGSMLPGIQWALPGAIGALGFLTWSHPSTNPRVHGHGTHCTDGSKNPGQATQTLPDPPPPRLIDPAPAVQADSRTLDRRDGNILISNSTDRVQEVCFWIYQIKRGRWDLCMLFHKFSYWYHFFKYYFIIWNQNY